MASYLKSLDDFLLQGKANGRRWATGSTAAVYNLEYTVTVSNLTFKPTIICCKYSETWWSFYSWDYNSGIILRLASTSSSAYTSANDTTTYDTGFSIAVPSGLTYKWIAIE